MESRNTANYFIRNGPWLAYRLNLVSRPKFSLSDIKFISANKGFTCRKPHWEAINGTVMPFVNTQIVKLELQDEKSDFVLKVYFVCNEQETDNYRLMLIKPPENGLDEQFTESIEVLTNILELHFGIDTKPLELSSELIKSLIIYEYTTADDIVLEMEDKIHDLEYELTLPSSYLIEKFNDLKEDSSSIDCAIAEILRKTISEQINLPKVVGFEVESCRLQKTHRRRRKKIRSSDVEEIENIDDSLDRFVLFEMSDDDKPSVERCNQIFNWMTRVK